MLSLNLRALEKLIQARLCDKARELYEKFKKSKPLYADFVREALPECFPGSGEKEGEEK